jgi:hypothetical protein
LQQIRFSLRGVLAILCDNIILFVDGDKTGVISLSSPVSFINWVGSNHLLVHYLSGEKTYWRIAVDS